MKGLLLLHVSLILCAFLTKEKAKSETPIPKQSASYNILVDVPAFPGAEGFGRLATGGRGGQDYLCHLVWFYGRLGNCGR